MTDRTYTPDEVQQRLARDLPHWKLDHGAICRTYRTNGWKGTLMVVNTIGHLAEAAWHHPDLAVSFPSVEVKLSSHDAHGITDRDFAMAAKIEEVVMWRPAAPLEGTPQKDPAAAYIKYD